MKTLAYIKPYRFMKPCSLIKLSIAIAALCQLAGCAGETAPGAGGSNNQSNAGSTASILPYGDVAYALDGNILRIIDLQQSPPTADKTIPLLRPETVFINKEHLYIGGEDGVDIFDIADPNNPVKISTYQHLRSCDPIIVDDGIGYVTLRSGFSSCPLVGLNRLEVIDMSNPAMPELINDFDMTNPYGLAKTDTHLAVCEEAFGLTLIDVQDPQNIQQVANYSNINCFDLIYEEQRLIATASDGIYQFSAESEFISLLSRIPVGKD